ncbi:MAG: tryptophan synthase subunit alpha [Gammaproteobacteria bacterium]|nr:tryptophan synthase subunit alpha [Gammaproteobacteria bacterium]MDE2345781.1 tryptophan synthase subunit alpha [Gammaproteobacteria bacterium]
MSGRYARCFAALSRADRGAFIPFTVLGFPDRVACALHLEILARHADALELGIPFSDPVADGPTIQRASRAALDAGANFAGCLQLIAAVRSQNPELPIGLLVYANLVVHRSIEEFYRRAAAAGVDSVLIADVPSEEGEPFAAAARDAGVAPVFIAPPNADDTALDRIARLGAGYTYVLTRRGITGTELAAGLPAPELLMQLKARAAPPAVLGFGVSEPRHVSEGIAAGAAGVISGSAVVNRLMRLPVDGSVNADFEDWLVSMHEATRIKNIS